jgi:hypothetical protein
MAWELPYEGKQCLAADMVPLSLVKTTIARFRHLDANKKPSDLPLSRGK